MSQSNIKPIKERCGPEELPGIIDSSNYPKPRWMVNESIRDEVWLLSKVGFDRTFHQENIKNAKALRFDRRLAPGEYLTDKINQPLLTDIQNSLLYLDVTGKITRPNRVAEILISTTKLILHANELRRAKNEMCIRSLEQIKFAELEDYLLSFAVDRRAFDAALESILGLWNSKQDIDWDLLKNESGLTTRKFESLKYKLTCHLKANIDGFESLNSYNREFEKANTRDFNVDLDLFPNAKTISNEISKLEALNTARPAQKYKFRHSPRKLFSSGLTLFETMQESVKTLLMPVEVSLHAMSSALYFVRVYGPPIKQYLSDLDKSELERIAELEIAPSTSQHHLSSIKEHAYNFTKIPAALKNLDITSWDGNSDKVSYGNLKSGMSVCLAVTIYTAAIWILLASFTAGRTTSLQTLRRNCFKLSPVDGLFDLVMRIPKSSERLELEELHRPIPDLIYDYGLEFASLACNLEERRGHIAEESELFLFGGILSYRSMAAFRWAGGDAYKFPLSDDYINDAIAIFQDWSESPLFDGKRYYPVTHQFRRLFAVLYFNFSDDVGLEELCWFMGHSNLDQTFHYAEIAPTEEWMEEAESTIAKIGAALHKSINGDTQVKKIIDHARKTSSVSTVLEPLVRDLISEHKKETGQEVRFCKIDDQEVFFYFSSTEER